MGYAILTQDRHGVTQGSYVHFISIAISHPIKYTQVLKYRDTPVRSVYNLPLNITVLRDDHQHVFSN